MPVFLKFRVSGHDIGLNKLAGIFQGRKAHICKEGQVCRCKYTKENRRYTEDVFLISQEYPDETAIDDAAQDFISGFKHLQEEICALSRRHRVMFCIGLFPEGYHSNVRLSPKTLSLLAQFYVELNIESSFLQGFYDGDEI